jgi:hypothetical protein
MRPPLVTLIRSHLTSYKNSRDERWTVKNDFNSILALNKIDALLYLQFCTEPIDCSLHDFRWKSPPPAIYRIHVRLCCIQLYPVGSPAGRWRVHRWLAKDTWTEQQLPRMFVTGLRYITAFFSLHGLSFITASCQLHIAIIALHKTGWKSQTSSM